MEISFSFSLIFLRSSIFLYFTSRNKEANAIEMSNVIGLMHKRTFKEDPGITTKSKIFCSSSQWTWNPWTNGSRSKRKEELWGLTPRTSYQEENRQLRSNSKSSLQIELFLIFSRWILLGDLSISFPHWPQLAPHGQGTFSSLLCMRENFPMHKYKIDLWWSSCTCSNLFLNILLPCSFQRMSQTRI